MYWQKIMGTFLDAEISETCHLASDVQVPDDSSVKHQQMLLLPGCQQFVNFQEHAQH